MIDLHQGFTGRDLGADEERGSYIEVALRQAEVIGLVAKRRFREAARTQVKTWRALGAVAWRDARGLLRRARG